MENHACESLGIMIQYCDVSNIYELLAPCPLDTAGPKSMRR